jgi:hypothetical protein
MNITNESRPVTAIWPATDGLVRCADCARQTKADKGGRMRFVCTADKTRPSLVQDIWRRCSVARNTGRRAILIEKRESQCLAIVERLAQTRMVFA